MPSIVLAYLRCLCSAVTVGAVRVTCILAHLPSLYQITEHDNHSTLPLINHLPEISASGLHGTLGYDKSSLLLVALNRECFMSDGTNIEHLKGLSMYIIHSQTLHGYNLLHLHATLLASNHLQWNGWKSKVLLQRHNCCFFTREVVLSAVLHRILKSYISLYLSWIGRYFFQILE